MAVVWSENAGFAKPTETSLNVPEQNLREAMDCIDDFIVDIKDMNPEIYRRYTGGDNVRAIENLRMLIECVGAARILVRTPHIPDFNTSEDVARSAAILREMGVEKLDEFSYVIR